MSYLPTAKNAISTTSFNSKATGDMAPAEVFQGVGEDISAFAQVGISIISSNSANGILTIEVSRDNIVWGGPSRTWSDTSRAQPHMWNRVEKYFRIKYTNGNSIATDVNIQVDYSTDGNILLAHQLDEVLQDETEAIVTRSVLVGQNQSGAYLNVPVDASGNLKTTQDPGEVTSLLEDMLKELKIINKYNQLTHEVIIDHSDS